MWLNELRRRWQGRTRLLLRRWPALGRPARVRPGLACLEDRTTAQAWMRASNPPAFYNRGYAFYQKGEYERAIADFSAAIRLCRPGEEYLPLRMRGMAYLRCGQYPEAIADFTQVLRLEPADAHAYACRGTATKEIGEYDRAIADCTQALRRDPDSLLSYVSRAFSYLKKADHAHAVADYSAAIRLEPENREIYEGRAKAYRAAGNVPQACADERKAEELRDLERRGSDKANGSRCDQSGALRTGSRATSTLRCNSRAGKPAC